MIAKTLEELQVYQRGRELEIAVTAILQRTAFQKDIDLRNQIREAADSVVSNIAEGFEQSTDRPFAGYLVHAKASNAEVRARLEMACRHGYVPVGEVLDSTTSPTRSPRCPPR